MHALVEQSRKLRMVAVAATVGLVATVVNLAAVVPPAAAQACPMGTVPSTVTWGASGGIVWDDLIQNSGLSKTYANVGGSGVDMTLSIDDPAGMNEDADNALVGLPVFNWDGPFYTKTDGAYGAGYLTAVMTSVNETDTVTFSLAFSAPVHLPAFSIGDIDFSGNTAPNNSTPHDSFQDEILLTANRNGTPVGFVGTTGTQTQPVVTLNDPANGQFKVAGGPYGDSVNGNLGPADAAGTVSLQTLAPVTGITIGYSNGPDDQAADAVHLANAGGTFPVDAWAPPLNGQEVGVSNNHAVRFNIFTLCTGALTVGDRVWADVDGDGVQDAGEPGVPGVTVTLIGQDGLPLDTTTTAADGTYSFTQLPPWDYTVEISDVPAGYTNSYDLDGGTGSPDNSSGVFSLATADRLDADFGLEPPLGSISGTVFNDRSDDGSLDSGDGDTGIGGVTVTLTGTDLAGNLISDSVVTAADGTYAFTDVPAGTYVVTEAQPAGYTDGIDTPGNGATNTANDEHTVVLGLGASSPRNDFAEVGNSSITGTVFEDLNNDGDPVGENGIGGVTVTLTGTDDGGNAVSLTTTTVGDGTYVFDSLRPGTYDVTETQPSSHLDGKDDAGSVGGDDTTVNDVISGAALPINTDATDYDFGELPAASIAGTVEDQHGNPIPDTTITLSGTDDLGNAVSASTTTDASGDYSFTGLRPGTYTVTETQPVGYTDGPDVVGTEGGNDTVNDVLSAISLGAGVDAADYDFIETSGSISGSVVDDFANPIPNTPIALSGTDDLGNPVTASTTTDANGDYSFVGLMSGTYTLTESQPTGYGDGGQTAGSTGGADSADDVISGIGLPAGADSVDNDFDETTSSIAGTVFEDLNNDGEPGLGEAGIEGVTVTLTGTDDLGNPVSLSTMTDANGDYSFDNLLSGSYTVTETQPSSHIDGIHDAGSLGGDDTSTNDVTTSITLPGGTNATDYDFGELEPAILSGTVFEDDDNDGVQGGSEVGIEGVNVTLTGTDDLGNPVSLSTVTDADGNYSFGSLRPGSYTVTEVQPAGYRDGIDTAGSEGGDDSTTNDQISTIDLPPFTNAIDYDFGELPPASIGGAVVDDFGGPIADTTITLSGIDDLGNPVSANTTTDANGDYSFTDLRPGTYTVTETQPTGYGDGGETAGSTGGDDSANDVISAIVLDPGDDSVDNDFDEITSSIAGTVFEDDDNDGVQAGAEIGVEGVTVTLTGTDDLGNPVSLSTMTDADGNYGFDQLISGTYVIDEVQPTGYYDGIDTAGSEGGDDSTTNDQISAIVLDPGTSATDYDFGELQPAGISGSVTDDFGNPIAGVLLSLSGTDDLGNPISASTTTDADGEYMFTDLRPGTYTVTETQPTGYGDGGETAGSTGGDDSADDVIAAIPLPPNTQSTDNDFIEVTSSLSGTVFHDRDDSGTQDDGEPAIEGVNVTLTGTDDTGAVISLSTTTDSNGDYVFETLLSGTYTVTETHPVAYEDGQDLPGDQGGDASLNDEISGVALPPGTDAVGYDFAELGNIISGSVWLDRDEDGEIDAEESTFLEGVELSLLDDQGNVVAMTTTDENGNYSFPSVAAGEYSVSQIQPDAYGTTTANVVPISVPVGGLTDIDFGEDPASVAGVVWDDDTDPNGVKDPSEPVVAGVVVNLLDGDGSVVATTTTAADGTYHFGDLPSGTYSVEIEPPASDTLTTPEAGQDDKVDSDFAYVTDNAIVELIAGDDVDDIDAGVVEEKKDLEVDIESDATTAPVGSEVTYTVLAANTGNSPVVGGVDVEVIIPDSLRIETVNAPDGWSIDVRGQTIVATWNGPVLPGESPPEFDVVTSVLTAGTANITAVVATSDGSVESTNANNQDNTTITVPAQTPPVLAFTGRTIKRVVAVGVWMVLMGMILVYGTRRRRLEA